MKDYRTWWRYWGSFAFGCVNAEYPQIYPAMKQYYKDFRKPSKYYSHGDLLLDIVYTDCMIEQIMAIREGLA